VRGRGTGKILSFSRHGTFDLYASRASVNSKTAELGDAEDTSCIASSKRALRCPTPGESRGVSVGTWGVRVKPSCCIGLGTWTVDSSDLDGTHSGKNHWTAQRCLQNSILALENNRQEHRYVSTSTLYDMPGHIHDLTV
jgi:hypothetical protein